MQISQKTHYALMALFELTKHHKEGAPLSIPAIAETQSIPAQFLQTILRQLRQGGFVESFRGKEGGYRLAHHPRQLTMAQVIRFLEGPIVPFDSIDEEGQPTSSRGTVDPFADVWGKVARAQNELYSLTTFEDIVESWKTNGKQTVTNYVI